MKDIIQQIKHHNFLQPALILLVFWASFVEKNYCQTVTPNTPTQQSIENYYDPLIPGDDERIVITNLPGKNGKEVGDTTIAVNSELVLYASLYKKGQYDGEISVKWFWDDTSHASLSTNDTKIYLGSGKNIIFKPAKTDTGIIFTDRAKKLDDTTGTITIVPREKLALSPVYCTNAEITRGQENILVTFKVENTGFISSIVNEADLVILDIDSRVVKDDFAINRIDTNTFINAGQTKDFRFHVTVDSDADTGQFFIDGKLITEESMYTNFAQKHTWQVQTPPLLIIDMIDASNDEVVPGQEDVIVSMHVSNHGGASVNQIIAELLFWHNGIDVSDEYEFQMSDTSPQIIGGYAKAKINLVVRVKPSAEIGSIIINGNIYAKDSNTGVSFSDKGTYLPASWSVQLTLAQVGIISTKVNCPNRDQAGDGHVNFDQSYSVDVVVKNQGTDEVKDIVVTLETDGNSIYKSDTSQVIASLFQNQLDTVRYNFIVYAKNIPALENFTARIDSAFSISGRSANVSSSIDSVAHVAIMYPAHLNFIFDGTFLQVPINQAFDIDIHLDNASENADCDSSGAVQIDLPNGYSVIHGNPFQNIKANEIIRWKIKSPSVPTGPDSIIVFVRQKPHDRNNPLEFASIDPETLYVIVETLPTYLDISDVSITSPGGARDNTLSTGQKFTVSAHLNKRMVENVYARIDIPGNYFCQQKIQYLAQNETINWSLLAPSIADVVQQKIIIQAWGNVENDTTMIFSTPDSSLSVLTVEKANLKVNAEIINPASAFQGQISPNLEFKIKGEILNLGNADIYGDRSLKIQIQEQDKFTLEGDSIQSISNNSIVWTVRAANSLAMPIKPIKIRIIQVPFDENTDSIAYLHEENKFYDVQLFRAPGIALVELMVKTADGVADKTIAPNTTGTLMGIEFANLSQESGFPIWINGLDFDVEDKDNNRIAPSSVLTGFRIRQDDNILGEAKSFSQNSIHIEFIDSISIDAQEIISLKVEGDFHDKLTHPFKINLPDTSHIHIFSQFDIQVVNEQRIPTEILNIRSHLPEITQDNLRSSFCNYPNPFGSSSRKYTQFRYYLPIDTDIEIKIYTLIGELVWKSFFTRNQPQGKKGLHQEDDITWDGKNLKGNIVMNGVYIARIQTSYGDWAITKIAVIK